MAFYDEMAATAVELIAEFGMAMTLVRVTEGAYDPATSTQATTSANHTATGIKLDYRQSEIDGTMIRVGDQRVFLAPDVAVTPRTGDKLTISGESWQVVQASAAAPAGTVVVHKLQVRK